jgi:hypothetical protein
MGCIFAITWLLSDSHRDSRDRSPSTRQSRLWKRFKKWLFEPISTQEWYISEQPRKKYNKREASKDSLPRPEAERGT